MTAILAGGFLPGVKPHWREDSIVNASRRIGGQTYRFLCVKGGDRFDQPDGSDGDQIVHIFVQALVFFYHMSYETEISFDQDIFCFRIALLVTLKIMLFLGRCQRFLEGFQIFTSKRDFFIVYVRDGLFVLFQQNLLKNSRRKIYPAAVFIKNLIMNFLRLNNKASYWSGLRLVGFSIAEWF